MSKKMQDFICSTLAFVILSVLFFVLLYLGGAFVEVTLAISRDAREVIIFAFAVGMLCLTPAAIFGLGPFMSAAIEERWKD